MSNDLKHIQQHARELARSGRFVGSKAVAFELQFEPGYAQAFGWLHNYETLDELDRLCAEARMRASVARILKQPNFAHSSDAASAWFASPGLNYPTEFTSLGNGGLKGPGSKVCFRGRGRVSGDPAPQKLKPGTAGWLLVGD